MARIILGIIAISPKPFTGGIYNHYLTSTWRHSDTLIRQFGRTGDATFAVPCVHFTLATGQLTTVLTQRFSNKHAWAKSVDPDQTPRIAASDQDLHFLQNSTSGFQTLYQAINWNCSETRTSTVRRSGVQTFWLNTIAKEQNSQLGLDFYFESAVSLLLLSFYQWTIFHSDFSLFISHKLNSGTWTPRRGSGSYSCASYLPIVCVCQ